MEFEGVHLQKTLWSSSGLTSADIQAANSTFQSFEIVCTFAVQKVAQPALTLRMLYRADHFVINIISADRFFDTALNMYRSATNFCIERVAGFIILV